MVKGYRLLSLGLLSGTCMGCALLTGRGVESGPAPSRPIVEVSEIAPRDLPDAKVPGAKLDVATPDGYFSSQVVSLADQLEKNLEKKYLGTTYIVTSFANLDRLSETSAFGRLVAENLVHELKVRNWNLVDIRLTKDLIINDHGEFSLSRDIKKIRESYKVSGIIVGTYSVNRTSVILNARVINLDTGLVISAGQIHLPMNAFSDSLLSSAYAERTTMKIVGEYNVR